jgi:hypothetical protein
MLVGMPWYESSLGQCYNNYFCQFSVKNVFFS